MASHDAEASAMSEIGRDTGGKARADILYDKGTRAMVLAHGRVGVGEVFAIDETPRETHYGVRFTAERRLMFRAHEVAAYRETRYETIDAALRTIFAGFRAEDEAIGRSRTSFPTLCVLPRVEMRPRTSGSIVAAEDTATDK